MRHINDIEINIKVETNKDSSYKTIKRSDCYDMEHFFMKIEEEIEDLKRQVYYNE